MPKAIHRADPIPKIQVKHLRKQIKQRIPLIHSKPSIDNPPQILNHFHLP